MSHSGSFCYLVRLWQTLHLQANTANIMLQLLLICIHGTIGCQIHYRRAQINMKQNSCCTGSLLCFLHETRAIKKNVKEPHKEAKSCRLTETKETEVIYLYEMCIIGYNTDNKPLLNAFWICDESRYLKQSHYVKNTNINTGFFSPHYGLSAELFLLVTERITVSCLQLSLPQCFSSQTRDALQSM